MIKHDIKHVVWFIQADISLDSSRHQTVSPIVTQTYWHTGFNGNEF